MDRPTAFLSGADIGTKTVWTWQWHEGGPPEHAVTSSSTVSHVSELLAHAIPDPAPPSSVSRETAEAAVKRALSDGAFSRRDSERELTSGLARAFLPERLREQIRTRCAGGPVGVLRVLPPPSAYAVPWELLPVDEFGHTRLVELMDVVHVAPPLTRDGTDAAPAEWDSTRTSLLIVDPEHPDPVLARFHRLSNVRHARHYQWPTDAFSHSVTSPFIVDRLRSGSLSRLLWIGHVASSTSGVAALRLKDDELSATDLFDAFGHREPGTDPAHARTTARVGLVACRSGADLSHVEPFGLVVAFLEAGAQLVTATRWTLPTDRAFFVVEHGREPEFGDLAELAGGPFNTTAHAVDRIQATEDPVHSLGQWQRERLRAWLSDGALVDSPIMWASLANYHAPYRTVETPSQSGAPVPSGS